MDRRILSSSGMRFMSPTCRTVFCRSNTRLNNLMTILHGNTAHGVLPTLIRVSSIGSKINIQIRSLSTILRIHPSLCQLPATSPSRLKHDYLKQSQNQIQLNQLYPFAPKSVPNLKEDSNTMMNFLPISSLISPTRLYISKQTLKIQQQPLKENTCDGIIN